MKIDKGQQLKNKKCRVTILVHCTPAIEKRNMFIRFGVNPTNKIDEIANPVRK
jgi:hypothetical protein